MPEKKPDTTRSFLSFGMIVIIALVIGVFLKNVRLGLLIVLALGLLGSTLLRRR